MTRIYILSGMSGAGKSQALKIFEDFGFVSIDNIPIEILKNFVDVCIKFPKKYKNTVISIDARSGQGLFNFKEILNVLKNKNVAYKIIFLNATDAVLVRRYSETRHRHPLGKNSLEGIQLERKAVNYIFTLADVVIDTSNLTTGELKKAIAEILGLNLSYSKHLNISVVSFGYKYGLPSQADIVFDVRFIANPNYIHKLKFKTGKNAAVQKYIKDQKEFKRFFPDFSNLIKNTLPGYIKEGKSYLTIAVGCTGGRHRSVFTAELLAKLLAKKKYTVSLNHRDILQDTLI
ncbi:MAG: RNase adapter RapZ [Elusimicrobiota bacterium]|jgi:UPF0042 nucleotide-binding protein|nr:RNase adapter RapZ [Elusimicrobiota bacterium]